MSKHFFWKTVLVIGCCGLGLENLLVPVQSIFPSSLEAYAQQTTPCLPFPPGINPVALLKLSQVQQELDLTDWQIKELSKLQQNLQQELTQVYHQSKPSSSWTDANKRQFFMKVQEVSSSKNKQLTQILRPPQFTRLREIMIQVYGWQSLNQNETVELLKLTKDQQNRLRKISEETNQQVIKSFQVPPDQKSPTCPKIMEENRKKLEQIRKSSQKKADQVLSAQQKQLIQTLQGNPFNLNIGSLP